MLCCVFLYSRVQTNQSQAGKVLSIYYVSHGCQTTLGSNMVRSSNPALLVRHLGHDPVINQDWITEQYAICGNDGGFKFHTRGEKKTVFHDINCTSALREVKVFIYSCKTGGRGGFQKYQALTVILIGQNMVCF